MTRGPLQELLLENSGFMSQKSDFMKEFASISSSEKGMIVVGVEEPGYSFLDVAIDIFNNSTNSV